MNRAAGRYISFGSTHTWETGMQTYVVGVQTLAVQPALPPPATAPKRHIYCDLAVRSAVSWHALYVALSFAAMDTHSLAPSGAK